MDAPYTGFEEIEGNGLDFFSENMATEIDNQMLWTVPVSSAPLPSASAPVPYTGISPITDFKNQYNASGQILNDQQLLSDNYSSVGSNQVVRSNSLEAAGFVINTDQQYPLTTDNLNMINNSIKAFPVLPPGHTNNNISSNGQNALPPGSTPQGFNSGFVSAPLELKKSYTLAPSSGGLQSQYHNHHHPLGGFTSHAFHENQSQTNPDALNNGDSGPLLKSHSFDSRLDPKFVEDQSSGGKIRKKGLLSSIKHEEDFVMTGKSTFGTGVFPYPTTATMLQQSRSSGSVDRLNRLTKIESNLSRCDSALDEEDDAPHSGTYAWLEDFKDKGEMDRPRTKPVFRACANCKKAHLACDATRPCKRCVHLGKAATCVDVEHKKRGRPKLPRNDDGSIKRLPKSDRRSDEESGDEDGFEEVEKEREEVVAKPPKAKKKDQVKKEPSPPQAPNVVTPSTSNSTPSSLPISPAHQITPSPTPLRQSSIKPEEFSYPTPNSPGGVPDNDVEFLSIHSLEGYYSMASPECEILFGFGPQEYILHSIYEFVHVDDLENLSVLHTNVLSLANEIQKPIILRLKHKYGYYLKSELAMTVYKNPETGKQQSLICSVRLLPPEENNPMFSPSSQPIDYQSSTFLDTSTYLQLRDSDPNLHGTLTAQITPGIDVSASIIKQEPQFFQLQQPHQPHHQPHQHLHQPRQQHQHQHQQQLQQILQPNLININPHLHLIQDQDPRQMLQHSASFDTLSNSLGGMKFLPAQQLPGSAQND